jgi:7-cyano-7-deazaguanine synthase
LDRKIKVPNRKKAKGIPSTYVPARNTIFLSFAVSYAEAIGADSVFIGANAIDFSGYPDCRPAFYKAFQKVIQQGTKKKKIRVLTPLIDMSKAQIIALGLRLEAPLKLTWSCYRGGKRPCGICDSCKLRKKGFSQLGIRDIIPS